MDYLQIEALKRDAGEGPPHWYRSADGLQYEPLLNGFENSLPGGLAVTSGPRSICIRPSTLVACQL